MFGVKRSTRCIILGLAGWCLFGAAAVRADYGDANDTYERGWLRRAWGRDEPHERGRLFFPHGIGLSYGGSYGYPNYPTHPYDRPFKGFPLNEAEYISPNWGGLGYYKQGYGGDECRPVFRWMHRREYDD
jgi:hypothetical protein